MLCDEFLKGAAENGHEVKKIRLAEKKIAPCAACYGCTESHVCVRKDDMAEVLDALKAADVIFGTGTWDKGDVYRHPSMKQAFDMGKEI